MSAWTCATRRLSFVASAICVSTASRIRNITTTSPVFIVVVMAAGHGCTPTCPIIATGCLSFCNCPHCRTHAAVQRALEGWSAEKLETAAAEAGSAVTACLILRKGGQPSAGAGNRNASGVHHRTNRPAPPKRLDAAQRPLSGIKVLDLTRIIAGPVCGRTLAAHGADVLLITAPHLPSLFPLVVDTGRGKLSASLDLRDPECARKTRCPYSHADVFVQGYRPGGIARFGFGPEDVARLRPGVVYVSLCAFSHVGPWAARHGFDSLCRPQAVLISRKRKLLAKANRARCRARSSITRQVTCCLRNHGSVGATRRTGRLVARAVLAGADWTMVPRPRTRRRHRLPRPAVQRYRRLSGESPSGFGRLTAVRHSATMSETTPRRDRPTVPLGTNTVLAAVILESVGFQIALDAWQHRRRAILNISSAISSYI